MTVPGLAMIKSAMTRPVPALTSSAANSLRESSRAPMIRMRSPWRGFGDQRIADRRRARRYARPACLRESDRFGQPVGPARLLDRAAVIDGVGQVEPVELGASPRPKLCASSLAHLGQRAVAVRLEHDQQPPGLRAQASRGWRRSCPDCARNRRSRSRRRMFQRSRGGASALRSGLGPRRLLQAGPRARAPRRVRPAHSRRYGGPGPPSRTSCRSPSASTVKVQAIGQQFEPLAHDFGAGAVEAITDAFGRPGPCPRACGFRGRRD